MTGFNGAGKKGNKIFLVREQNEIPRPELFSQSKHFPDNFPFPDERMP